MKTVKNLITATLLSCCILYVALPSQSRASGFSYGNWSGEALYSDNGEFTRCVTVSEYVNGISLGIAINNLGRLEIWLRNSSWNLKTGKTYDVIYSIDNFKKRKGNADVQSDHMVRIGILESRTVLKELRKGYILRVRAHGKTLRFSLKDTFKALDQLKECYYTADTTTEENPFESRKRPNRNTYNRKNQASTSKLEADAKEFVSIILGEIDTGDIRILSKVPDFYKHLNPVLTWTSKHGMGVATSVPVMFDREFLERNIASADKRDCNGEFGSSSSLRNLAAGDSRNVIVVKTACASAAEGVNPVFVIYTFYPIHGNTAMVRVAHVSFDSNSAIEADKRFFNKVSEFVRSSSN